MSTHNRPRYTPFSPKQTTVDDRRATMDTALGIAAIMIEANERLFRLQSEAVHAALADNSKHITTLLNTTDSPAALLQWPTLYQESAQKMVDLTRSWFEIASQTQAELGKLLGVPFASFNVEAQKYLDQFANSITDGRNAAATQVKDFLAKAAGSGTQAQAAKKERVA